MNLPLYQLLTRPRTRLLLETLEDAVRSPKSEEEHVKRNALTIEHVLPQAWQTHWPLPHGHSEEDIESRQRILQTLGNLTLLNDKLNPALSNAEWPVKKAGLSDHSVLFLNKDILGHAAQEWEHEAILQRSRRLIAQAIEIWPRPQN